MAKWRVRWSSRLIAWIEPVPAHRVIGICLVPASRWLSRLIAWIETIRHRSIIRIPLLVRRWSRSWRWRWSRRWSRSSSRRSSSSSPSLYSKKTSRTYLIIRSTYRYIYVYELRYSLRSAVCRSSYCTRSSIDKRSRRYRRTMYDSRMSRSPD